MDQRKSIDWKMFWTIENQDLEGLASLCQESKQMNKDVGLYFRMMPWNSVFTQEESLKIKVELCGLMDFSPIQHACDIGWIDGMKTLFDYNIGCNLQGYGLSIVNKERFLDYYNKII